MPSPTLQKHLISDAGPQVLALSNRTNPSLPEPEDADAREQQFQIHEIVRDTRAALQELRFVLLDSLEVLNLPDWELIRLLDERPTVIRDLVHGETDDLSLEAIIGYLEKLQIRL